MSHPHEETQPQLPEHLRPYFWDADFARLDPVAHRRFIAERLMEKTIRDTFRWLLAQYDAFFMSPGMISAELSSRVCDLATDLRATHGLKTADALHLAAALSANCEELWTNDGRLGRAAGDRLRVVIVGET